MAETTPHPSSSPTGENSSPRRKSSRTGYAARPKALWILPLGVLCVAYSLLGLTLVSPLSHQEIMQRCVLVDPARSRLWSVGNIEVRLAYLGVFGGMLFYFLRAYSNNRQHRRDLGLGLAYLLGSFALDYACVQALEPFPALLIGDAVVITFTALVSRRVWFQRLLGVFVPLVFLTCGIGHFLEGLSYWRLTYPINVPWTMVTADIGFAILLNASRFPAFIRGEDLTEELAAERIQTETLRELVAARIKAEDENRESHQNLVESEHRLRQALESGKLGSWELNLTTGEYQSATATFKALYGFRPDEEFTVADRDRAIHPDDLAMVYNFLAEAARTGETSVGEFRIYWPDGSLHWLRVCGQAFRSGAEVRLIGVIQDVTAQKEAVSALQELAERQQHLLRDVLASVTGGKLRLVETEADLPAALPDAGEPIPLTATEGLYTLRQRVKAETHRLEFGDERWQDLMTAASESGMNTITHGGGQGEARVSADEQGAVQVRVQDWGTGINMQDLPNATLSRGWSSTTSLGHGLVMMLEAVDRLWLLTGSSGTTVVMEKDREEPPPAWL